MRVDRFLSNQPNISRKQARIYLASGQVSVAGKTVTDPNFAVTPFCQITLDGQPLQSQQARYFMLNKPTGYLSATEDDQHPTVMELLDHNDRHKLHIAGRLDRSSTGLLLLTNDGRWSQKLTEPDKQVAKIYRVTTANPIDPETAEVFADGIYFSYEGITTKPVRLEQLGDKEVRLTLYEGRYHQIKRMFGRFRNPVLTLHREQIGEIKLGSNLKPGHYRPLTDTEIASVIS
ncbi:MAG: pseudouridine synthase [Motiliproteus sp.]|nr:pseudouridine synthase [Motiliproteus sp.]MCW9051054.1 pseudouridine synthase [Motiliproteus sp.]